jgi:hypothetical protein
MKITCGSPRKLTNRQVVQVLNWHQKAIQFRHAHGTQRDLARVLGTSLHVVRGCLANQVPLSDRRIQSSNSPGRPRHLNPVQISFAVTWRNAGHQFRARHGTVASLARSLGVGASTIHDCIRREGRYVTARRANPPRSDDTLRSELLRTWVRAGPKL